MARRADTKGGRSRRAGGASEPTFLSWLLELGEQKLGHVAEELVANPRIMDALGNAFRKAAKTKGQVDRNMQLLLNLLNVPSKADYELLLGKLDTLQGSLTNLNIKVDRILAQSRHDSAPAGRSGAKAPGGEADP